MAGMRDTLDSMNQRDDELRRSKQREGNEGIINRNPFVHFVSKVLSLENIWALLLFLIVVALIIFTTDSSPAWIYQGF